MGTRKILAVLTGVVAGSFLVGCETMMAHYRMGDMTLNHIAKGSAAVNVCLANGVIDKNVAFAYASVSAQLLDISVLDRDAYKRAYETNLAGFAADTSNIRYHCNQLEQGLPKVTQDYATLYGNIARDLSLARAQEQREMATMMANFGNNWAKPVAPVAYNWPKVSYASTQPAPSTYLVKTSSGMLNCRTTDKNFVFCM